MRHLALAIAAVFMLALVAPAFAQPFADVPADHWAFDAIAELAAKGILEGYPDGTFKGDRAMTRYEMAMALARILARIEAIKIPPPPKIPPPEVRKADIDRLQRLINEFRAELSALGVRITAVEEELAALKARLDNVRVTGNAFFRSDMTTGAVPTMQLRNRFQFTGSVSPALVAVARARFGTFSFGTPAALSSVTFDLAYFDWAGPIGSSWRVGRQLFTLGPNGLLFDGSNDAPTAYIDGARVNWAFGPLALTTAVFRDSASLDLWAVSASFAVLPGWTTAVQYYNERSVWAASSNSGFGFNLSGSLVPGVSLAVDYASFTAAGGTAQSAYKADLTFDLARLSGVTQFAPTLGLFYKNYGPDTGTPFGPKYTNAEADTIGDYSWNMKSWGATLGLTLTPTLSLLLTYEAGNCKSVAVAGGAGACSAANAAFTETYARLRYAVARSATLDFVYFTGTGESAGSTQYRIELNYSW